MENPYAPPQTAGTAEKPELSAIELAGPPVRFAGRVTRADVAAALGLSSGSILLFMLLILLALFFCFSAFLESDNIRFGVMSLGVAVSLVVLGVRKSGWGRARRYLHGSPRVLEFHHGEITATTIRTESVHGWTQLHWDGIYGLDLRHDRITLALNPQHLAFIFLPRHLFEEADWGRLVQACTLLVPSLPFQPSPQVIQNSTKLATGPLPDLDVVAEDAILLDGSVTTSDLLNSPLGRQLFRKSIMTVCIVSFVVSVLLWSIGAFEVAGHYLWFLALLPAFWIYRLSKWLSTANQKESPVVLKIRAAITENQLHIVTPRARSITYWSALSDALVGDNVICLRETDRSPNVVPLPRSALVDPQQWIRLVELTRRKVAEDEAAEAIEAKLVEQTG